MMQTTMMLAGVATPAMSSLAARRMAGSQASAILPISRTASARAARADRLMVLASDAPASDRPGSAEMARTIVEMMNMGTLSTVSESGHPLGTYVGYVLDAEGMPVLRLRAEAEHTKNLGRDKRCSIYVQPPLQPGAALSRVTLIGTIEATDETEAAKLQRKYDAAHADCVGVDAPLESDAYYKFQLEECFFVGGYNGSADTVPADAFLSAEADPLKDDAAAIVNDMNETRQDALHSFARYFGQFAEDDVQGVQMTWVDKLGFDIRIVAGEQIHELRVPFSRAVIDERDCRSALTMMAQLAWETEKNYIPPPIEPVVMETEEA